MGNDLWIVKHESSCVGRDYEFFEWLLAHFTDCESYGYIDKEEFKRKVKEETPEFKKKFRASISDINQQFRIERAKLPKKEQKWFCGFSFSIG